MRVQTTEAADDRAKRGAPGPRLHPRRERGRSDVPSCVNDPVLSRCPAPGASGLDPHALDSRDALLRDRSVSRSNPGSRPRRSLPPQAEPAPAPRHDRFRHRTSGFARDPSIGRRSGQSPRSPEPSVCLPSTQASIAGTRSPGNFRSHVPLRRVANAHARTWVETHGSGGCGSGCWLDSSAAQPPGMGSSIGLRGKWRPSGRMPLERGG